MEELHFILNWAALLLWIGARPGYPEATERRTSLRARLIRTGLPLTGVVLLLLGRAVFYDRFSAEVGWIPTLNLASYVLPFGHHHLGGKLAFSLATFGQWLVAYYYCLFFLSLIAPRPQETIGWQRFLRTQLGPIHDWPVAARVTIPLLGAVSWYYGMAVWLGSQGTFPEGVGPSTIQLIVMMTALNLQAVAWLALGVLGLYVIQSYVVLGNWELWKAAEEGGLKLLRPVRVLPLRAGRIDLSPLVAMVMIYGGGWMCGPEPLGWLSRQMPF